MNKISFHFICSLAAGCLLIMNMVNCSTAQNKREVWAPEQLLEPSALAAVLADSSKTKPEVFDIGPSGTIKGAIQIGSASEKENIEKLKEELEKISRDKEVVIYCGCCPFDKCPNVRPAFELLNKMGFAKPRLLNLSTNLKTDWIDKGFPMQ